MLPVAMNTKLSSTSDVRNILMNDLAMRTFDHARIKGKLYRFWTFLTHRSSRICNLRCIETARILNRRYEGVYSVRIDQIRGSENRSDDFDIHFNPIHVRDKERWVNVAMAMLRDAALPPVELIKVDDTYFVRDGHHRISVARNLGQEEIDAVVTSWELTTDDSSQKSA